MDEREQLRDKYWALSEQARRVLQIICTNGGELDGKRVSVRTVSSAAGYSENWAAPFLREVREVLGIEDYKTMVALYQTIEEEERQRGRPSRQSLNQRRGAGRRMGDPSENGIDHNQVEPIEIATLWTTAAAESAARAAQATAWEATVTGSRPSAQPTNEPLQTAETLGNAEPDLLNIPTPALDPEPVAPRRRVWVAVLVMLAAILTGVVSLLSISTRTPVVPLPSPLALGEGPTETPAATSTITPTTAGASPTTSMPSVSTATLAVASTAAVISTPVDGNPTATATAGQVLIVQRPMQQPAPTNTASPTYTVAPAILLPSYTPSAAYAAVLQPTPSATRTMAPPSPATNTSVPTVPATATPAADVRLLGMDVINACDVRVHLQLTGFQPNQRIYHGFRTMGKDCGSGVDPFPASNTTNPVGYPWYSPGIADATGSLQVTLGAMAAMNITYIFGDQSGHRAEIMVNTSASLTPGLTPAMSRPTMQPTTVIPRK